jgi:hypothetical protein
LRSMDKKWTDDASVSIVRKRRRGPRVLQVPVEEVLLVDRDPRVKAAVRRVPSMVRRAVRPRRVPASPSQAPVVIAPAEAEAEAAEKTNIGASPTKPDAVVARAAVEVEAVAKAAAATSTITSTD